MMQRTKQGTIALRRARTNNLADLDLDIPRNQLVVFVGRSGSGKSSLVFDTIAAEAGYQLNETFPPFARNRLPKWTRPEVEHIGGLTPVIVIDQRRIGGNARSTVGTITDAWTYLRLLFSRLSEPYVGESNHFSFNDPVGMCPTCSGLGEVVVSAVEQFLDLDKSLADGAIRLPGIRQRRLLVRRSTPTSAPSTWTPRCGSGPSRSVRPCCTAATRQPSSAGSSRRSTRAWSNASSGSTCTPRTTSPSGSRRPFASSPVPRRARTAPATALNRAARTATVLGYTIGELSRLEIAELLDVVRTVDSAGVVPVVAALTARLEAMVTIGLGYLTLSRATTTLSGGESQRIKTVKHLGSSLTEMTYVVDEPTVGLHPTDVESMIELLERLRDSGNSVLVVEHDPAVMAHADQIIEVGPEAGNAGGRLVFQGTFAELRTPDTSTGRALARQRPLKVAPRRRRRAARPWWMPAATICGT